MGGMFLELDDNQFDTGERATITFDLEKDGTTSKQRINVVIMRSNDEGLGISFSQSNAVTYRAVQELLKYGQQQTVH